MSSMTQATLDLINREYQKAVKKSTKMYQIVEILYDNLFNNVKLVDPEDIETFWSFLDGLRNCMIERSMTFEITDFFTDLNSTLMYIIKWLNKDQNQEIDLNWYGRRKSLKSDLTKILEKACNSEYDTVSIRDRFGLRGILLNKDAEKERVKKIYIAFRAIIDILTKTKSPQKERFVEWYQHNSSINKLARCKLDIILNIPFKIETETLKDYIAAPKDNNYRTLQFTLGIAMHSDILPGAKIEIQLRDLEMHQDAEYGSASHDAYKDKVDKRLKVFELPDNRSEINLIGFDEEDRIGLEDPKHFADRLNY